MLKNLKQIENAFNKRNLDTYLTKHKKIFKPLHTLQRMIETKAGVKNVSYIESMISLLAFFYQNSHSS